MRRNIAGKRRKSTVYGGAGRLASAVRARYPEYVGLALAVEPARRHEEMVREPVDVADQDRIGRRIELTQAGRLFLVEARAVLARAATAETVLADITGLKRGSLTLAASQTVGNYWLPPLMNRYRASYPGIALALTIGNTETVAGLVREGAADLGFVEGPVSDFNIMLGHNTLLLWLSRVILVAATMYNVIAKESYLKP